MSPCPAYADQVLIAGVIIGAFVVVFFVLPYVAQRSQDSASKGSTSAGAFGVFDEIFQPGAHRSRIVIEQLKERKADAPIPGADENDEDDQKQ
jgi:hypothetical protein